jgi:hypothetical protein
MKREDLIFAILLYLAIFIVLMLNGWKPTNEKMSRGILAMHCSWIAFVLTVIVMVVRIYI